MNLSPMMKQYEEAKAASGDAILLFRMGDFYELFHEDAKTVARVLGLTLTSRDKGENPIPMAGFPVPSVGGVLGQTRSPRIPSRSLRTSRGSRHRQRASASRSPTYRHRRHLNRRRIARPSFWKSSAGNFSSVTGQSGQANGAHGWAWPGSNYRRVDSRPELIPPKPSWTKSLDSNPPKS